MKRKLILIFWFHFVMWLMFMPQRSLFASQTSQLPERSLRTVGTVLENIEPRVQKKLIRRFEKKGIAYPPQEIALLAFKKEKKLELWAKDEKNIWTYIRSYQILGASGNSGPKLKEGDRQVPEGIYNIAALNPNSHYHLSLKVDYPNNFDRQMAKKDGRTGLGGDIYIHGNRGSRGCLAMGDPNIEPLFTLVAKTGGENTKVIIAPNDLRKYPPLYSEVSYKVSWIKELYEQLMQTLLAFR